ncbi:hypothetical protein PSP20601_04969 [Pandoraea sputorum]|nr:hypothetical protein PSP20601_04969 [Pandoraea sputorum]
MPVPRAVLWLTVSQPPPSGAPVCADRHDAMPGVPENLNFSTARAVSDAHRRIGQTQTLHHFSDEAVDGVNGVDQAKIRDALATLMLYACADERNQSSEWIPGSRDEALATLADHLSLTGTEALLRSLNADPAQNASSQYLADPERCCLAGHAPRPPNVDHGARPGTHPPAAKSGIRPKSHGPRTPRMDHIPFIGRGLSPWETPRFSQVPCRTLA